MANPRNTNEELYAAQKFARVVMGTNSVDVVSNDRPGIVEGLQDVFGYFAGGINTWDLANSSTVMVVSANLTEEQNVLGVPIKRAVREGTQKLIVIDSREVELTRYAHLWLRPYPGTDPVLLGGLLRVIIDSGLADHRFHQRALGRLGRVGLVAGAVHAGGGVVRDGRAYRAYRAGGAAIRDRRIGGSVATGWRQLNRPARAAQPPGSPRRWRLQPGTWASRGQASCPSTMAPTSRAPGIWAHGQRRFRVSSSRPGSGGP